MKRTLPPAVQPLIRINRYLSMSGISSRRRAEELVAEGKVSVNGVIVSNLATKIHPTRDRVFVEGKRVALLLDYLYLVLNKPKDTITTLQDERGRTTVMSLVRTKQRVFPIGRLDRNTTGVLLFTNDGEFSNHLMHPRYGIPKSYHVVCDRVVRREHIEQLKKGVRLEKGPTSPAQVFVLPGGRGKEIGIIIQEGKNRQVRKMFEAFGYDVVKLDRVAYGPVTKEGLARGGTRSLTRLEVRQLRALAGMNDPGFDTPE